MSSLCKQCQAEIRWVRTLSGKRMALNPEPDPLNGKVWLDDLTNTASVLRKWDREQARKRQDPLYTVHWDRCPGKEQDL